MSKKRRERLPKNQSGGERESGAKSEESGWLLGSSNGYISHSCADSESESVICTSVWTVHLSAHTSIAVVETKIELDTHAGTCVVGEHCLIVHDHNRPVNVYGYVYGYNPKAGSKDACIVDAAVAYAVPETGQVVILSINQAIEMKGLDYHLLCPMQCYMNVCWWMKSQSLWHPFPGRSCMPYK